MQILNGGTFRDIKKISKSNGNVDEILKNKRYIVIDDNKITRMLYGNRLNRISRHVCILDGQDLEQNVDDYVYEIIKYKADIVLLDNNLCRSPSDSDQIIQYKDLKDKKEFDGMHIATGLRNAKFKGYIFMISSDQELAKVFISFGADKSIGKKIDFVNMAKSIREVDDKRKSIKGNG